VASGGDAAGAEDGDIEFFHFLTASRLT